MCMQCGIARCANALLPTEIRTSRQLREHGDGTSGWNLSEQNANIWGTGIIFIILGVYQHRTACDILTMKKACAPCERTRPHLPMSKNGNKAPRKECILNAVQRLQLIWHCHHARHNVHHAVSHVQHEQCHMYHGPVHRTAWHVNKDPFSIPYQTRCSGLSQML